MRIELVDGDFNLSITLGKNAQSKFLASPRCRQYAAEIAAGRVVNNVSTLVREAILTINAIREGRCAEVATKSDIFLVDGEGNVLLKLPQGGVEWIGKFKRNVGSHEE